MKKFINEFILIYDKIPVNPYQITDQYYSILSVPDQIPLPLPKKSFFKYTLKILKGFTLWQSAFQKRCSV